MVGLDGEKMSKCKGNLVLVSQLRRDGVDPMAIRLALLARHHAHDWMWTHDQLVEAQQRLATLARGPVVQRRSGRRPDRRRRSAPPSPTTSTRPRALEAVDRWATPALARGGDDPRRPGHVVAARLDALLGVRL